MPPVSHHNPPNILQADRKRILMFYHFLFSFEELERAVVATNIQLGLSHTCQSFDHPPIPYIRPQLFFKLWFSIPSPLQLPLYRHLMENATDYDEQSEVLFLFNGDTADAPTQTEGNLPPTQTDTNPLPPTVPSPTTPQPTQPTSTPLGADQTFWAAVYTLQPPHALMGVLTDLLVHRFVLHQHLEGHTALADTPIGHQPLTDTLPPPVQRLIAIYHSNVQRAQHHTHLALRAIDTLARFPPAEYFTDPNLSAATSPTQTISSSTNSLRFYPVPTAAARHTTVQDATTQTFPPSISVMAQPLPPLLLHESQQTTPRPSIHNRYTQTDIHGIVQAPAFASLTPILPNSQADSSTSTTGTPPPTSHTPTSAANKKPHDRWQYANLIPTPPVTLPEQPLQPPTFPSPIGGTPRNRHSKTPPRATTPNRVRQPDPRTGSPTPQRSAPHPTPHHYQPTVNPLPKRPPPSLYQAQQTTSGSEPLQPVPAAAGWPTQHGGQYTPTPSAAPPHTSAPPTYPMAHPVSVAHTTYPHASTYNTSCSPRPNFHASPNLSNNRHARAPLASVPTAIRSCYGPLAC